MPSPSTQIRREPGYWRTYRAMVAVGSGRYRWTVSIPPTGSSQRWQIFSSLALCAIGLALSGYTLWVHIQPSALVCVSGGAIDCQAVLTSAQSVVLGIPVPVFGIVFFLVIGALCRPSAWRSTQTRLHILRLVVATVGIFTVLYLISTELFTVKKICLWCTGVHLVTFALFVIIATSTPSLVEQNR
jgi:uncharacterized membrane protein